MYVFCDIHCMYRCICFVDVPRVNWDNLTEVVLHRPPPEVWNQSRSNYSIALDIWSLLHSANVDFNFLAPLVNDYILQLHDNLGYHLVRGILTNRLWDNTALNNHSFAQPAIKCSLMRTGCDAVQRIHDYCNRDISQLLSLTSGHLSKYYVLPNRYSYGLFITTLQAQVDPFRRLRTVLGERAILKRLLFSKNVSGLNHLQNILGFVKKLTKQDQVQHLQTLLFDDLWAEILSFCTLKGIYSMCTVKKSIYQVIMNRSFAERVVSQRRLIIDNYIGNHFKQYVSSTYLVKGIQQLEMAMDCKMYRKTEFPYLSGASIKSYICNGYWRMFLLPATMEKIIVKLN